jgi:hypothetical protein
MICIFWCSVYVILHCNYCNTIVFLQALHNKVTYFRNINYVYILYFIVIYEKTF